MVSARLNWLREERFGIRPRVSARYCAMLCAYRVTTRPEGFVYNLFDEQYFTAYVASFRFR